MVIRRHGRDIFFDESDRLRFYDLLEEGVKRFDVRIPALCLMSNHVHLVVLAAEIPDLCMRLGRDLSSPVKRSIVCANVRQPIPVRRLILRGYEKAWDKYKVSVHRDSFRNVTVSGFSEVPIP